MGKVYGIDLGTTNSAIAVFDNDTARVIKNAEGQEITPSVVFFTGVNSDGGDECLVGMQAKNSVAANPDNVIQFVKRMMGQNGDAYSFKAPSGKMYTPEMISALILKKVCGDAEQFEGADTVKDVVITVPAYFDDARRTATKQAGEIAGLNVLRIINEPTAAAISFGLDSDKDGKALVYDLGGGTFDVTVMNINGGSFDVIATDGDPKLGGINFDQKILSMIIDQLKEQGCEISEEDDALMSDLREKAEQAKLQLSNVETVHPIFTVNGKTYKTEITREMFEKESEDLLKRTQIILNGVLKAKDMTWNDIDYLLLVGGSTKMPMVKKMLEEISGKEVTYKVDPDTAVARGAAIFASTLSDDKEPKSGIGGGESRISVSDVTSQSLGTIALNGRGSEVNAIIIPHNTKIPCKKSETFYTVADNQVSIKVEVTEGDDEDVEFVNVIGSSILPIPPHPANSPVEIFFAYDADQVIYVEVIDRVTNDSLGTFEVERKANLSKEATQDALRTVEKGSVE